MKLYRIAKKQYIHDLSGQGARLYGGRWNSKGTKMLYTASNRSLATVEYLVHLPIALIPRDVYIIEIKVPSDITQQKLKPQDLPENWSQYPAPFELAKIGDQWINDQKSLMLKVPSSVVKGEYNVLINPLHKMFKEVRVNHYEVYDFDHRLLKK